MRRDIHTFPFRSHNNSNHHSAFPRPVALYSTERKETLFHCERFNSRSVLLHYWFTPVSSYSIKRGSSALFAHLWIVQNKHESFLIFHLTPPLAFREFSCFSKAFFLPLAAKSFFCTQWKSFLEMKAAEWICIRLSNPFGSWKRSWS